MNQQRRVFLQGASALAAAAALGMIPTAAMAARPREAFLADDLSTTLNALFNSDSTVESADIKIKAPDIAENGAVVPISVTTTIAGAQAISIIAENNPNPLAASFALTGSSAGLVSTRIKMGATSDVYAVVMAGGKLYSTKKQVKVTIGGCGG